ncbi:MAG: DUF4982 domain-containing protein [Bacteroidales bacterium]|nr:DUF4982 domain-containing protein [Bacteroidales bacterium]
MKRFSEPFFTSFPIIIAIYLSPTTASAQLSPRQRISINNEWRFTKGDPADAMDLSYDFRPAIKQSGINDLSPVPEAAQTQNIIKTWILPSGNDFTTSASKKAVRPEGNPGGNVSYVQSDFDDSKWDLVNLPHDWAIGGPFIREGGGGMGRLPSPGIGWYRRKISISSEDLEKSIFLDVDGAMSYATVWLNEKLVGGWPYGYASWRLNLTPYIKTGENQLVIRLDNPPNSSRWYPGGGIYRNVWLVKTSAVHIGQWGTYVKTRSSSGTNAEIELSVTVDNDSKSMVNATLSSEFFMLNNYGRKTGNAVVKTDPVELQIPPGGKSTSTKTVNIANPRLWGPIPNQKPNRYVVVTTVRIGGEIIDSYQTLFGIRTIRFDPIAGLFVNNEQIEIQGVCMHHDLGSLGSAINHRALQRQLKALAEMGVNAVRTSHNPPAPELLDMADSIGLLIMDEAFDIWEARKTPLDYHLLFNDWYEQDLRAFIRRDRNHPSIFMWSIGNEAMEQVRGEAGANLAKSLSEIVHEEDPTRPTTTAMNSARAASPFPAAVDLIGLNYQGTGVRGAPPQYPVFRQKYPTTFIYGSETAASLSTRGVYTFPVSTGKGKSITSGLGLDSTNRQVSSYDVNYVAFGASPDMEFESQDKWPYVGGEFVWTGWDYLGEPTPYNSSRSSYYGIIDLAGFRKDRFYLYQSRWRPDFKMAHILPHWTWPDRAGKITPVHVYSSADEAELFLNNKSLGRKKKNQYDYRFRWDSVIYEPGELKVITYRKGKKWATDVMRTAGNAFQLELSADRNTINSDGKDLSFITLRVLDSKGTLVPQANNHIVFEVSGPGEIVSTDNGDPTSFVSFQSKERDAFNGLALVIVRAKAGMPGIIKITAKSDGLKSVQVTIKGH